jgi:hypothetical protein
VTFASQHPNPEHDPLSAADGSRSRERQETLRPVLLRDTVSRASTFQPMPVRTLREGEKRKGDKSEKDVSWRLYRWYV